ncbi:MAG: translation initiation factor [Pseudomonadota bacterium]
MRLIDQHGNMLGVMSAREAQMLADKEELDLVEISPNAKPPVCKIMDFGKYKYELSKKASSQNHNVKKVKEIQLSMHIAEHDIEIKVKHAIEFLQDKHDVRFIMKLKGRDMRHEDKALALAIQIAEKMKSHSKTVDMPKANGKKIIFLCHHA